MLFLTTSSFAAVPLPSGWFISGNAGITDISNTHYGSGNSLSTSAFGFNFNAGYKFMPFLAGEAGYTKYGETKIKNSDTGVNATAKNTAIDLAGKAILPLGDLGAELFTKLGVAWVSSHLSGNGTAIASGTHNTTNYYLAVGAGYSYSANSQVVAQWARAQGNDTTGTSDLFSAGLTYTFA
jgi:hypothetical protein